MTPTERRGDRRVALHLRETLPEPAARQRDRLADRLRALEAAEQIDYFEVRTCPKRIRSEAPDAVAARDRYLSFAQWARDRGVRLRPFFATRECYAADTGELCDWLVFPAITLAVYDEGDLVAVYPHADGEEYRSVADGLSALAGGSGDLVGDHGSVALAD
ncbi:hypothetical protein I7X12_20020 [Halosimplex litoreum]|uniref:Uncharacterized protein n=1 Tax=Halosimplex litoreum TaxID=1198301 RepID=A0A7T3KV64_9EURY|nr:HTH domain-containing protein [Halosimplex litoreum]QPV62967.1 hypothetical protein I7X12_20020 [Halosimplex litoreum]